MARRRKDPNLNAPQAQPANPPEPPPQPQLDPAAALEPQRFSWSSSLLTMWTLLGAFIVLCITASNASTLFALRAARPVYAYYPLPVAAMLVGGVCALICYVPTMLAVLTFQALFGADIRQRGTSPPSAAGGRVHGDMVVSVLHDGATTVKVALVVAPLFVMALGLTPEEVVETMSLAAASGGQLVAAVMTLKILLTGMKEIWGLVPLVVFRWDRDAGR